MSWVVDIEHRDFQAVRRSFVDRHVRPAVGEAEALGRVPQQPWKEPGAAGLPGLPTPAQYGGSGGDHLAVALLAQALAKASGSITVSPLVSAYMAAPHIALFGSPERLGVGHPQAARSVAMAKYHTALAADARVLRIGGGADEIQLPILSRELTP